MTRRALLVVLALMLASPASGQLSLDVFDQGAASTGSPTWTHTPTDSDPECAVVAIAQNTVAGATDLVTGVTWGALPLTRAVTAFFAPGSEDLRVYLYHSDGADVPDGAQTITVTATGSTGKRAVSYSLTGSADCELEGTGTDGATGSDPTVTVSTGASVDTFGILVLASGHNASGSVTTPAGMITDFNNDGGASLRVFGRLTSNDAGGGWTNGWTASSEQYAIAGAAFREGTASPPAGRTTDLLMLGTGPEE